jgi:hypothetical protein
MTSMAPDRVLVTDGDRSTRYLTQARARVAINRTTCHHLSPSDVWACVVVADG